jgi:hypothetical protein
MALGFYITAKGFTQERYDTTLVPMVARVHNEIKG